VGQYRTIRVEGLQQIDDPLFPCEQMVGDGQAGARRITALTIPQRGEGDKRTMATGNQAPQNSCDLGNLVWSKRKTILDIPIGSDQRKIAGQRGREFLFCHEPPIDAAFLPIPALDVQLFTDTLFAEFAAGFDGPCLVMLLTMKTDGDKKVCRHDDGSARLWMAGMPIAEPFRDTERVFNGQERKLFANIDHRWGPIQCIPIRCFQLAQEMVNTSCRQATHATDQTTRREMYHLNPGTIL